MTAGNLMLVRANATAATPQALRDLRLTPRVRLGEVADVFYSPADPTAYVRLNGESVISLGVVHQAQSNSVAISEGIRAAIERINRDMPELRLSVFQRCVRLENVIRYPFFVNLALMPPEPIIVNRK